MLILGPVPEPGPAHLHWVLSRTVYAPCDSFCACRDLNYSQVMFQSFTADLLDSPRLRATLGAEPRSPGAALWQVGRSLLKPFTDDIVTANTFRCRPPRQCGQRCARCCPRCSL